MLIFEFKNLLKYKNNNVHIMYQKCIIDLIKNALFGTFLSTCKELIKNIQLY